MINQILKKNAPSSACAQPSDLEDQLQVPSADTRHLRGPTTVPRTHRRTGNARHQESDFGRCTPPESNLWSEAIEVRHLPLGYRDLPKSVQLRLARELLNDPVKTYIHCHHGQHRGPAAALAALRALGQLDQTEAKSWLDRCGVGYQGLRQAVQDAQPESPQNIQAAMPLEEAVATRSLSRLMAEIDQVWDRLKKVPSPDDPIKRTQKKTPPICWICSGCHPKRLGRGPRLPQANARSDQAGHHFGVRAPRWRGCRRTPGGPPQQLPHMPPSFPRLAASMDRNFEPRCSATTSAGTRCWNVCAFRALEKY